MSLIATNGYELANYVLVKAGESWFSEQLHVPENRGGVSFEVAVTGSGTGNFIPRAGNRKRHGRASEVVTTPLEQYGMERLPVVDGIDSGDLPDLTEAPKEWFINLGNWNGNYAELQFKCLTGYFRLTVIAGSRQG